MANATCQLTTRFPPKLYDKIVAETKRTGASHNKVVIECVKKALEKE